MRRTLLLIVASALISGCAAPTQIQPMTTTYDLGNYQVGVVFQSGERGCVLSGAVLQNKSDRPLGYVYTRLLSANADKVTVSTIDINFPPTVQGGIATAVHATSNVVAMVPCTAIKSELNGSKG